MRRWLALSLCLAGALGASDGRAAVGVTPPPSVVRAGVGAGNEFVPGQVLAKFSRTVTKTDLQIAAVSVEALKYTPLHLQNTYLLELSEGTDVRDAVAELAGRPDVVYAQPNYIYHAAATPNDPQFGQNWGLHNTGQTIQGVPGTPDADIDAPEAWDQTTGSRSVIVAVIDSGISYNHPDLQPNIWTNPDEIPGNGIDDDGNDYTDDVHGYDFVDNDGDPLDYNDHGTHVAGTIGAHGNNGVGVTGVNWQVTMMAVRGLNAYGSGTSAGLAEGIFYACENGAHITNNSWGSGAADPSIFLELAACPNVLHVVAAGNSGFNLDVTGSSFPCEFGGPDHPFGPALENIVCVASTTNTDGLSNFSNYGTRSVDLAAPGSSVLSSVPAFTQVGTTETFDPTASGWTGVGSPNTWARVNVPSAGDGSAADSPGAGANYSAAANNRFQKTAALNFAGIKGCGVDYQLNLLVQSGDAFFVEASTNGGASWNNPGGWSGNTGGTISFFDDLSFADGAPSVLFRLGLFGNGDGSVADGVLVDDISFRCLNQTGDTYAFFNGTSMASPHVAGVAALYMARHPSTQTRSPASVALVKAALLGGVEPKLSLAGKTTMGGRVNAANALAIAPPLPTPQPQPQPQPPPQPQPTPPPPPSAPPPPVSPPAQVTPRCIVPNVKGKTVPKAKAALKARRCAAGKIRQAFSGKVKKGRVIAQSRRPGTRHPRGTKINLIVSKGAKKK